MIQGDPDPSRISTSYVERSNLTLRMSSRRFTRLTNAFSKKVRNHAAAVALQHMHYNFARTHRSLTNPYPRTPAMAAGIADHIWTCEEIAALLDQPLALVSGLVSDEDGGDEDDPLIITNQVASAVIADTYPVAAIELGTVRTPARLSA